MRFVADECLHVVTTMAPSDTGASDEVVLERAARAQAILLTADKDFGKIAIARGAASSGIVLFRHSVADPAGASARLLGLIQKHGAALHGLYAVITPTRARLRRLPALRAARP